LAGIRQRCLIFPRIIRFIHLTGVHRVYLMGMLLTGVYLTGMHLMGIHLIGGTAQKPDTYQI
jgi:hypothetical protein